MENEPKSNETTLTEQQTILGEVKQELDEKKKKAVKAYVVKQLKIIQTAEEEIESIKAETKERIAEERESIAEAKANIKAIESGEFDGALENNARLADHPITLNWTTYASTSSAVYYKV